MDSPGGIKAFAGPARPRDLIAEASATGVGVMGIRAVQAGALTSGFDRSIKDSHPDMRDYIAAAPFRALCAAHGLSPAAVAHRYGLGMDGVQTVVLGVKNRSELTECLDAEMAGPLPVDLINQIDALGLARAENGHAT